MANFDSSFNDTITRLTLSKEKLDGYPFTDVQSVFLLLGLCSTLIVALHAANQATKMLKSRQTDAKSEEDNSPNVIERIILHTVKWVNLMLSLLIAMTIFTLVRKVMQVIFRSTVRSSLILRLMYTYTDLGIFLSLLASVLIMIWQKMAIVYYIVFLVKLPFRLMVDPPRTLCNYFSTSYTKAYLSLALYYFFYFSMGVACAVIFVYTELTTLWPGVGLFAILFNATALLSYILGTLFNNTLMCVTNWCCKSGRGGTRIGVDSPDGPGEDLNTGSVQDNETVVRSRYYYHISYVQ